MWIPRSTEELLAALPSAIETAHVDFKRGLPLAGKNADLAVDVAAMSTYGGTIIFGVEEDKEAGTFTPTPVALQGAVERISQVVQSAVAGPPAIECFPLPYDEEGQGFIVLAVPPSPMAPHMVEVKGEMRFYARDPGGNRRLGQGEVDRLYERRVQAERDDAAVIRAVEERSPLTGSDLGPVLFLAVRPMLSDGSLRARAWPGTDHRTVLVNAIVQASREAGPDWDRLISMVDYGRDQQRMDSIGFSNMGPGDEVATYTQWLEVTDDGTVRYSRFAGRRLEPEPGAATTPVALDEVGVVQLTVQVLRLAGGLYEEAGYQGPVQIVVRMADLRGSFSALWLTGRLLPSPLGPTTFPDDEVVRSMRVTVNDLGPGRARDVARALFGRFLELIRSRGLPDPLA